MTGSEIRALARLLVLAALAGCAHAVPAPELGTGTRIVCPGAGAVEVRAVGSFDGWGPGVRLDPDSAGTFAGTLDLPPGDWQVACKAGGAFQPPLNAPQRIDDGFGGQNGLFPGPAHARGGP